LKSLHWLPVHYRIQFKIILITFKCIHNLAPSYLSDLITIHQPTRITRQSSTLTLVVPQHRRSRFGGRSFHITGPQLFNQLPSEIKAIASLQLFKTKLKSHLFRRAFLET
jgi:hypothetical protein